MKTPEVILEETCKLNDCYLDNKYRTTAIEAMRLYANERVKNLALPQVITPFWLWLVRKADIDVIDAENAIEVRGFLEEGDMLAPVMTFAELLELYKSQNGL